MREQKCAATWGDILANTASYLLFEKAEFIVHKEQLIKQRDSGKAIFIKKVEKRQVCAPSISRHRNFLFAASKSLLMRRNFETIFLCMFVGLRFELAFLWGVYQNNAFKSADFPGFHNKFITIAPTDSQGDGTCVKWSLYVETPAHQMNRLISSVYPSILFAK